MSTTKLLVVLLILSAFTFPIFVCRVEASNGNVAASAISQAENVVASANEAVVEAEQAGAEISGLLARLNEAGELLTEAQVAFRLGDFDEAVFSANLCSEIGEKVSGEADELRIQSYSSRVMSSWLTMTGSLIGVVAVVIGSFWGWRIFKKRYYRPILRMKPEVANDES